jgi:peptidoglycan/LPS O-acetylase OafA/YrhL
MNKADVVNTKQHFEILDGLRGIASICVVIFHFMEFAAPDYNDNFMAHAYLAVDFFFCLSGFVIAYAYDNRLKDLGLRTFFQLRLIRLHPLVVIGSILGIIGFIADPFSDLQAVKGWGKTIMMFITSCLMVPYPVVEERYFNLYHLNPPTWSLLWEYVANIVYALALVRINQRALWIIVSIAAAALIFESYRSNFLSVGWGADNVAGGFFRVFFSFTAGILVYRFNWIIKSRFGFISLSLLLMFAFLFPFSDKRNWFTDPAFAIIYFPLIIALGAGAEISTGLRKLCRFSGDISYPLYMVHYPFLWVLYSYMQKEKTTMDQMKIIIPVGMVLLICFAWIIMKFADEPIRKYFSERLKRRMIN